MIFFSPPWRTETSTDDGAAVLSGIFSPPMEDSNLPKCEGAVIVTLLLTSHGGLKRANRADDDEKSNCLSPPMEAVSLDRRDVALGYARQER
jgi:hypothetical protein